MGIKYDTPTINTMINAYVIGAQYEKADLLFKSMKLVYRVEQGCCSNNPMIVTYARMGDIDQAIALFKHSDALECLHISSVNRLISIYAQEQNDYKKAIQMFDDIFKIKYSNRY